MNNLHVCFIYFLVPVPINKRKVQHKVHYKFYETYIDWLSTQAELGFQHSPSQYLGIDPPRDVEKHDRPIVWTHPVFLSWCLVFDTFR